MLIAMRRGAAGWVAKILFGLLILSFAVWGIGDYLTPDANPVVAEVGEIEIRRAALDQAERRQLDQMRRILGNQFNANSLPDGILRQAALEQLTGQAALDMESQTLGISVSDGAIGAAIRANPQFQTAGSFDQNLFQRALFSAGQGEDSYVASLRTELSRAQLGGAIAAKLPPPLPLAEAMYVLERQKRSVAHVRADAKGVEAPSPTDDELKQYVEANKVKFAEPERRDVRALIISPGAVARTIKFTDSEVANRYEDSKARYFREEKRTLLQALFQDEQKARDFLTKATPEAAAFQTAAEATGGSVTDLGLLTKGQVFPKAVADRTFNAGAGSIAGPEKTALGWHVVLIANVEAASTTPLNEVSNDLRAQMQQEQAVEALTDVSNAVEDTIAGGGDLAAASSASKLPVSNLNGIDRRGIDRTGKVDLNLPSDPAFLRSVFERKVGGQSGLIELQNGVFVALVVDAVHKTAPKAFETIAQDATEQWQAEKRIKIVKGRVEALASATTLDAFERAATEAGLTVEKTEVISRQDMATANKLPVTFVEQVFSASENTTVTSSIAGAVLAAFVSKVNKPTFDPTGTDEKTYLTELTDAYANDRVEALASLARATHPPSVGSLTPASPLTPQN
jgi:peptidyl-prolyl cis-trans isomerase D